MLAQGQVYEWNDIKAPNSHAYLLPELERLLARERWAQGARVLDFGCGNGSLSFWLSKKGFNVVGVDLSTSGVAVARQAFPSITFSTDVSAENIARMGPFDFAFCIEVIAHCFDPFAELKKIFDNLNPGATLMLATPYYGYLKTLVLAMTGRLGEHQSIPSCANYVSVFTIPSIKNVLAKTGFVGIEIKRVGRIPPLAKDMIVVARKPQSL